MKSNTKPTFQAFTPSSSRKKAPQSVATVLESALKYYRLKGKIEQNSVLDEWPNIVGEHIAQFAKPEKITRGKVLVVRVSDPIWAQELSLSKQNILESFRVLEFGSVIEDIRFVVSGPKDLERR